jgi:hypothetical protein
MRADPNGTHTEQQRARAGWINATTRRERIRSEGCIALGRTCSTCAAWAGNLIDTRAHCDTVGCSTHIAAVCEQWAPQRRQHDTRPHPTRPAVE